MKSLKKFRSPLKILGWLIGFGVLLSVFLFSCGVVGLYISSKHLPMVKEVTFVKGGRTVVFQGMSHIASPGFYHEIIRNISQKREQGFVYYYEGIIPRNEDDVLKIKKAMDAQNKDEMNSFMQGRLLIEEISGLSLQNDYMAEMYRPQDVNVDVSYEDFLKQFNKGNNSSMAFPIGEKDRQAIKEMAKSSVVFHDVSRILIRGVMGIVLGGEVKDVGNESWTKFIYTRRNNLLLEKILT